MTFDVVVLIQCKRCYNNFVLDETVPSITSKHNVTLPPQKYQTYKAKDNCNKERKKLLLQLMITAFKGEMLQEGESPEGGITAARIHAVEWKFDKMDVDKDKVSKLTSSLNYKFFRILFILSIILFDVKSVNGTE